MVDPRLPIHVAKSTLEEIDRQIQIIRGSLRRASDRQKSYTDLHRSLRIFDKRDKKFFLKSSQKRSSNMKESMENTRS